ncbi:MAG: metallophosphoesterase [Clostridia bacterium]|nr:metallophosphoesterase [Clostridia bacterium]
MKVFAISDLHLSSAVEKPMNIFGSNWDNHFERIVADWNDKVSEDDFVLLGGDMSWGMDLDEAAPDYALVSALKGRKIVIKGNHDLYWNTLGKIKTRFPEFEFLQNNALRITLPDSSEGECGVVIAGSRGWNVPSKETTEEDLKIYKRELIRLELSLKCAEKLRKDGDRLVVMLHFPPFDANYLDTEMTELIKSYNADCVLYGHLHGKNVRVNPRIVKDNIPYLLTSCDLIDFKLVEVLSI